MNDAEQQNFLEITACLKLIRWRGLSLRHKYRVVQNLQSFTATLDLNLDEWQQLAKRKLASKKLPQYCDIQQDLSWLKNLGNMFITIFDDRYPSSLKALVDPPLGLFIKGDPRVLNSPQLAIVGSRRQTPSGKKNASQFAYDLSKIGVSVTSGLAKGIDSSAHYAACKMKGKTVAVLGSGIDVIYPRENEALANMVQENGCLLSEFSIGTPPRKENFPARNRVIVGLSEGVLVVEAAQRSGSLITARLAMEQGKEVFAVPGSILSPQSKGCHWLIQQGAVLTQSIEDILFELQLPLLKKISEADSHQNTTSFNSVKSCNILAAVDYQATTIDQISQMVDVDVRVLSRRLLELELEGFIARAHNGDYFRLT